MDPRTRTHRRLHLVPATPGPSTGTAGRPPSEAAPADSPSTEHPSTGHQATEHPLAEITATGVGATDRPAESAAVTSAPPRPAPGSSAERSWSADPLTDDDAAGCTDAGLVAEIRACEASRHRLLHDQLVLLTEARRRGLRLSAGPSPARTGGTPT